MPYLTATLKLRPSDHDSRLMRIALARWHDAFARVWTQALREKRRLLRCLTMQPSGKLRVDSRAVHALVVEWCRGLETHLHSSASASLIVAAEGMAKGWLALYAEWVNGGRKAPKPGMPTLPAASDRDAQHRWQEALDESVNVTGKGERDRWQAELTREAHDRRLPLYFGAATSGVVNYLHCGLLRRKDGKLFALLTLWGVGDKLGAPLTPARNRRGSVANVRSPDRPLKAASRARSSLCVPVECGRGLPHSFVRRGSPKSGELIAREDGTFRLNLAFEFPQHERRPESGAVLSLRRGVDTLLQAVVLDGQGECVERLDIDGRALRALVSEALRVRAIKQQKGRSTRGDRRVSRVAEHHLYSAGHQVVDLACRHRAEIVLLADPAARKPTPLLAWKHFSRLEDILGQLCAEAGLASPRARKVYGSWRTCPACGWAPGPGEKAPEDPATCPGCGRVRASEDLAVLLALDTLRLRIREGETGGLGGYVRRLRDGRALRGGPVP